ncbi:MAG TPA: hypothetical protein VKR32_09655, partial [Puia sp.]|nr:hypothetical protein [Puia sp.]
MYNRPSWREVLESIADAYLTRSDEIKNQANTLTQHLSRMGLFAEPSSHPGTPQNIGPADLDEVFKQLMNNADRVDGGFGSAPKFPQTFSIRFLLHYHYFTGNNEALKQACLSLDKMIDGGIYDHLAGGFARYSTDSKWLVPHFEKMLYDNALLIILLSEAYQITQKQSYKAAIQQTMDFIRNELTSGEKGFYSAMDADSDGEEGKYYIWTIEEVDEVLQGDSELFCNYYGITRSGNWESKNILHRRMDAAEFARENNLTLDLLLNALERDRKKLLERRNSRLKPGLDDKIILSWNALMNSACCKAYQALGIEAYRELAVENMGFMLSHLGGDAPGEFGHSFKNGKKSFFAFLDDLAFMIQALVDLQEITGNPTYLLRAKDIAHYVQDHFEDKEKGLFYFTNEAQKDVILRKKEMFDGAQPSGNSTMVMNLLTLSIIFDIPDWKRKAIEACLAMKDNIVKFPTSFSIWATVLQSIAYDMPELVMVGEKINALRKELLSNFIPVRIFQSSTVENNKFPLLKGKPITKEPSIFLCKDYSCQPPVNETAKLIHFLKNVQKNRP